MGRRVGRRVGAQVPAPGAGADVVATTEMGRGEEEGAVNAIFGEVAEEGLSREDLGRGTWGLLHTVAAAYPEAPSRRDRQEARRFLHALAWLYPCGECAEHFRELLQAEPPTLGSQAAFAQWLCRAHNRVNMGLGYPAFDCAAVDRRWSPLACEAGPGKRANACERR